MSTFLDSNIFYSSSASTQSSSMEDESSEKESFSLLLLSSSASLSSAGGCGGGSGKPPPSPGGAGASGVLKKFKHQIRIYRKRYKKLKIFLFKRYTKTLTKVVQMMLYNNQKDEMIKIRSHLYPYPLSISPILTLFHIFS